MCCALSASLHRLFKHTTLCLPLFPSFLSLLKQENKVTLCPDRGLSSDKTGIDVITRGAEERNPAMSSSLQELRLTAAQNVSCYWCFLFKKFWTVFGLCGLIQYSLIQGQRLICLDVCSMSYFWWWNTFEHHTEQWFNGSFQVGMYECIWNPSAPCDDSLQL